MSSKSYSPAQVRAWGRENLDSLPESAHASVAQDRRGRLNPDVVTAFRKAHKGSVIAKPVAKVQVKVKVLDKLGRATTKPITITHSEARTLLGQVDADGKMQRGRLDKGLLALALEAREAAALDLSNFV